MSTDLLQYYNLQELRTMRTNAIAQGYKDDSVTIIELCDEITRRLALSQRSAFYEDVKRAKRRIKWLPRSNHGAPPPPPYDWASDPNHFDIGEG